MIYLDNNATTAIDSAVIDAIDRVYRLGPANASSQHASGRAAAELLEKSLEKIAGALKTDFSRPGGPRLIITSGGTESNHLALTGLINPITDAADGPMVLSRIEHPSVLATAEALQSRGRTIRWLPVERNGVVDLQRLPELIRGEGVADNAGVAALVSIMSANNETGVIQPIDEAARLCRSANVLFHVDATQSVGKVPMDFDAIGCSAITFTAHKLHGPVGIGGLWLGAGVKLEPAMSGGQQQLQTRPGTEPVALVAGMAEAIDIAVRDLTSHARHMRFLRDRFEQTLLHRHDSLVIHGFETERLPNTSFISFIGADRQSMLMALDLAGIACSSGTACSSGSSPPSHVLQAMHCQPAQIASALRFGVSRFSTVEEIDSSAERISLIYKRLCKT